MAPSTYYAAKTRPASARATRDAVLRPAIRHLWEDNYRVYGARKLWKAARRAGWEVGRDKAARLMRAEDIAGAVRTKRVRTTRRDDTAARHPDLVKRDFTATGPNQLWVTDLTFVPTFAGIAYVCFIVDAYSRMIVGWRVASHMRTEMVLDAIEMARWSRGTQLTGLRCHSDAGSQFTSLRYGERLAEIGAVPSIGTVGDSFDNARARRDRERLLQGRTDPRARPAPAVAHHRGRRAGDTRVVHWHNHQRLHGYLGDIPPAEFEGMSYATQQGDQALVEIKRREPPSDPVRFTAPRGSTSAGTRAKPGRTATSPSPTTRTTASSPTPSSSARTTPPSPGPPTSPPREDGTSTPPGTTTPTTTAPTAPPTPPTPSPPPAARVPSTRSRKRGRTAPRAPSPPLHVHAGHGDAGTLATVPTTNADADADADAAGISVPDMRTPETGRSWKHPSPSSARSTRPSCSRGSASTGASTFRQVCRAIRRRAVRPRRATQSSLGPRRRPGPPSPTHDASHVPTDVRGIERGDGFSAAGSYGPVSP
ncbi:hypothetical protein GCM10025864_13420 [Luteimicrobium album]|uniref:Integrase catalytic domain-containing protein n=1 Tax=Luteimicrobium album TaxID=1054550 RepID=A0ABQ6I080_9MICO|nr:hypothetical protein GCM10025864_13420 [Luteimicrobium album]